MLSQWLSLNMIIIEYLNSCLKRYDTSSCWYGKYSVYNHDIPARACESCRQNIWCDTQEQGQPCECGFKGTGPWFYWARSDTQYWLMVSTVDLDTAFRSREMPHLAVFCADAYYHSWSFFVARLGNSPAVSGTTFNISILTQACWLIYWCKLDTTCIV